MTKILSENEVLTLLRESQFGLGSCATVLLQTVGLTQGCIFVDFGMAMSRERMQLDFQAQENGELRGIVLSNIGRFLGNESLLSSEEYDDSWTINLLMKIFASLDLDNTAILSS